MTHPASEPFNIRILDREYTVGVAPDERDSLLSAARLLETFAVPDPRADATFSSLAFPRLLLLRARMLEAKGNKPDAARFRRLFELCAGDRPEMFGGK